MKIAIYMDKMRTNPYTFTFSSASVFYLTFKLSSRKTTDHLFFAKPTALNQGQSAKSKLVSISVTTLEQLHFDTLRGKKVRSIDYENGQKKILAL